MGTAIDIMHKFVRQEIRRCYSTYDGWALTTQESGEGYTSLVTLKRLNKMTPEVVKIVVLFQKVVTPDQLSELTPEPSPSGVATRREYVVMVPEGTEIRDLPANINVIRMKAFVYNGNMLTWVKSSVRRVPLRTDKGEIQNAGELASQ